MNIKFTKMQGCGNDYIYINCFDGEPADLNSLAIAMSPRHFSVGADGVVLICPSETCDVKMRMFNADGSEGRMCGNAIRCIGKYLYDNRITEKKQLDIETLSGVKYLTLHTKDDKVTNVTVDMGYAEFEPKAIPVISENRLIEYPIIVDENEYKITAVSVGNPHAVCFLDEIKSLELTKIGPKFEYNPMFPERVNTEFARIIDKNNIEMRVWERGSGETFACGTGACATVAAAVITGRCDFGEEITVHLIGGDLTIKCDKDYKIYMNGNAVKVYDGTYEFN
ncbi:MAG: diaminopimelate epimerase [Clostridiales bacterium GWF2_38_85]|nr:MAG: diaminopimelate epimerase [Clostridiales bacterium GWF2_38_85]HBL83370.1 diaminopimelate epimerase [Clostridiales bacterium]